MLYLVDYSRGLLDELYFRQMAQPGPHSILLSYDLLHLFFCTVHEVLQASALLLFIGLELLQLLVHFLHEISQLDLVLVSFLYEHLLISFYDRFTLILHFSVLLDETVNVILGLIVHLAELYVLVLSMPWVLYDCIGAEGLLAGLTVEKYFGLGVFFATDSLLVANGLNQRVSQPVGRDLSLSEV